MSTGANPADPKFHVSLSLAILVKLNHDAPLVLMRVIRVALPRIQLAHHHLVIGPVANRVLPEPFLIP